MVFIEDLYPDRIDIFKPYNSSASNFTWLNKWIWKRISTPIQRAKHTWKRVENKSENLQLVWKAPKLAREILQFENKI